MYCRKKSFLLKIKPRYFQVSFDYRIGPPKKMRFKEEGSKILIDLEK